MNNSPLLANLGLIRVHGQDAKTFLQGQLSCDLEAVTEQHYVLGCYCNIKGRMLCTFHLFNWQQAYWLLLPKEVLAHTLTTLKKYSVFSKVELTDASADHDIYGVLNADVTWQSAEQQAQAYDDSIMFRATGDKARYYYVTKKANTEIKDFADADIIVDENTWQYWDVLAPFPHIYAASSEVFTPHDVNFPDLGGVSFNKGCFLGQEIIARMHYRGKLKQRMYTLSLADAETIIEIAKPNTSLVDQANKTIGSIVNAVKYENIIYLLAKVMDKNIAADDVYLAANNESIKCSLYIHT